jgi:hypothetical protein
MKKIKPMLAMTPNVSRERSTLLGWSGPI